MVSSRPSIARPERAAGRRAPWKLALLLLLVLAVGLVAAAAWQYSRPLPSVPATPLLDETIRIAGAAPPLPWPATGAAAVAVPELGVLGTHGDARPRPTASTAKIMTALLVLEDHPLAPNEAGPSVTITPADVEEYRAELRDGQSVVPVTAGEQLTEYQLLQGLLLPSGNNLAAVLARWDAGSVPAFVARLNVRAAALGMASTHFADASGYAPQTVSTPGDLVLAAQAAMANPVFAAIVAQPQATLPVAGTVYNVNAILGQNGIVGVKTGSTPEAGACFVFAAQQRVGDRAVMVFGAVMGETRLADAFEAARQLGPAVAARLRTERVLARGQAVAAYRPPWGGEVPVVADEDVDLLVAPGLEVQTRLDLAALDAPVAAGTPAGAVTLQLGATSRQVAVHTGAPLPLPGPRWRVTRALGPSGPTR
ncbi:MAG TPA: D-alanyl-D-alanine carboxypeptidase [Chloroflexota bacterium]|nr:D-alanyl-D-alanine carboxypeptidase [Chloroflexota bacterium]